MEGGIDAWLHLSTMSKKTDLISNILQEDMLYFRREILVLKMLGEAAPLFVRRTIGNLSDPGTDLYERFQKVKGEWIFVEDRDIKEKIESSFVTPAYRYSGIEFMVRNRFGTTYENMLKHIIQFEAPDGVRVVSSEKVYDPFDELFNAIDQQIVSPRLCYIGNRPVEFLEITPVAGPWLMEYDQKSWKRLVTRINRVNAEANKKAAKYS